LSILRRGKRIDNNQQSIVKALRQIPGVTVQVDMSDILVGYRGHNYWFEIKSSKLKTEERYLKDSQKKLLKSWRGHYQVVHTLDEIINEINKVQPKGRR